MSSWFQNSWWAIGPIGGFMSFVAATATMEGVYSRPDETNKQVFSLDGLSQYLKAPFQYGTSTFDTVWGIIPGVKWSVRLEMLQLNWVVMTGVGTLAAYLLMLLL